MLHCRNFGVVKITHFLGKTCSTLKKWPFKKITFCMPGKDSPVGSRPWCNSITMHSWQVCQDRHFCFGETSFFPSPANKFYYKCQLLLFNSCEGNFSLNRPQGQFSPVVAMSVCLSIWASHNRQLRPNCLSLRLLVKENISNI